jgi:hypothetical protein
MYIKIIILLSIIFTLIFFCAGCGETQSHHWSTTNEIEKAAVGGWLIVDPPPIARDINLIYNIDTNEIWEFFQVDSFEIESIISGCEEVQETEVNFPRQHKRHGLFVIPGWPEYLTDRNNNRIEGLRIFRCSHDPPYPAWHGPNYYYLTIDKNSSKVFAWNHDGG